MSPSFANDRFFEKTKEERKRELEVILEIGSSADRQIQRFALSCKLEEILEDFYHKRLLEEIERLKRVINDKTYERTALLNEVVKDCVGFICEQDNTHLFLTRQIRGRYEELANLVCKLTLDDLHWDRKVVISNTLRKNLLFEQKKRILHNASK